jgi:hypothetical protein
MSAAAAVALCPVRAWKLFTLNDLGTCEWVVGLFASEKLANEVGHTKLGGAHFQTQHVLVEMPRVYQSVQEFENREQDQRLQQLAAMLTPEQIALVRSAAFDPYATI